MDVEVVTDKMPAGGLGIGGHDGLHMGQKILLCARGSSVGSHDLSGHHISTEDEGTGAVTGVLELASLHFSGSQRQSGVLTLQGLNPGQFIRADRAFALFGQLWSLSIDLTDRPHGFFFLRVRWRSQPVADQMRLQSVFFNKRAACRGEICLTIPRVITSSAISRPVHWLIGRPAFAGASHVNAAIWQRCSVVIRDGAPGRGASCKRSTMLNVLSSIPCKPTHLSRQRRTVSTLMARSRAIRALDCPSAAANTI